MDPLSITAAVVSFVDVAVRIKESVDKIGQNRQTLKELTSDVIDELIELRKLCQHREGDLNRVRLDYDSIRSLENLQSELNSVLERCLKFLERRKRGRLSSLKACVSAWIKNAEIEGDILRLRDRVSSVHRRFSYITSLRMENNLLVVDSENRTMMNRMEGLVSQLLVDSQTSATNPAVLLDSANPDGVELQFLRLQVQRAVDRLGSDAPTHTSPKEEPQAAQRFYIHVQHCQPQSSLMRSVTIAVLQIIQLLEHPFSISFLDCLDRIFSLFFQLVDLGLIEDAAAITSWAITTYRLLMKTGTTSTTYLVGGLLNLPRIRSGAREGLDAAKSAVEVCRPMVATSRGDHLPLARCLRTYADHLVRNDCYDGGVKEALAGQCHAPDEYETWAVWEAAKEDSIILSSVRSITKTYAMAITEGFYWYRWANSLAYAGRYSEAAAVGVEAINCFTSFAEFGCSPVENYIMDIRETRSEWFSHISPATGQSYILTPIYESHTPDGSHTEAAADSTKKNLPTLFQLCPRDTQAVSIEAPPEPN
ncbi:hypothetical protein CCMSSC00406_0007205 [Pleurotus cornucopiae]|uniref:Uncharacterized protein n=1 Tax=Pleurotus cornucopiae TaxID=5321 RepID=A0ACB7IVC0_PLECO|nr:hypothetical protein CCMSSC00406_0007205 [Pleurotus cornucopiae]